MSTSSSEEDAPFVVDLKDTSDWDTSLVTVEMDALLIDEFTLLMLLTAVEDEEE